MLQNKILQTITKYRMIKPGETVVAAVSGGPDSVAMLAALYSLQSKLGCRIRVAHLNHMLRRAASKDAEFVKQFSKRLGLQATIAKINVKKTGRGDSLEQACRRARYDFLFSVARKVGATKIALAHTKDDQAETVLMRLIRGTGLYGLGGILSVRRFKEFIVIRPLIEVSRSEVKEYLKKHKLVSRIDATNRDTKFLRNRIRHELLPLLEKKYNPQIKDVLYNLGSVAQGDYDFLDAAAEAVFFAVKVKQQKGKVEFDRMKFKKLHQSQQRMVMRLAVTKLKGDTRRLTFRHWEELEDLLSRRRSQSVVNLPQGISVKKTKDRILISLRNS